MHILFAEDEPAIASHVITALQAAGYLVTHCDNGPTTWELGGTADYDAIILDLGLPGLDGLTLLKRWRNEGIETPVMVLTARGSWMERVDGFDSGADDYLPKPFRSEELLARLRALLRRAGRINDGAVTFGRLTVDTRGALVSVDGAPASVSPSEFRALARLMAEPGAVVSAAELAFAVQGREDDTARNAVEVLINRLRRKLGSGIVETRRGFGYFIADERE
ncbi:MAG: response regulator transcription factor [Rhizobiaceae bacterium]